MIQKKRRSGTTYLYKQAQNYAGYEYHDASGQAKAAECGNAWVSRANSREPCAPALYLACVH